MFRMIENLQSLFTLLSSIYTDCIDFTPFGKVCSYKYMYVSGSAKVCDLLSSIFTQFKHIWKPHHKGQYFPNLNRPNLNCFMSRTYFQANIKEEVHTKFKTVLSTQPAVCS